MADKNASKDKGMTVFRSDRHEDMAAIVCSALVVVAVLVYMAFLVGPISFMAPSDGKIVDIAVNENTTVKKGDLLLTMLVTEKKVVHGEIEQKAVAKQIKSKTDGVVLSVAKAVGDEVKKDKDVILVVKSERGSLP